MIKSKFAGAFILGICLTVLSSTAVFAEADKGGGQSGVIRDGGNEVQAEPVIDSELLQKQREIDEYVFKTHASEIADKGITVTHTGPMDRYVEIGITPYSEESAGYLYGIFGKDKVKVVEGQQAVLMIAPDNAPDVPAVDPDKAVSSRDEGTINTADDAPLYATDLMTTTAAENAAAAGMSPAVMAVIIAGAVFLLGGGALLVTRRLKAAGR